MPGAVRDNVAHVEEVLPALVGCEVVGAWSGVMPFVPDQKPLCGALEDGLWIVTGCPFTKGAAYSRLLADMIIGEPHEAAPGEPRVRHAEVGAPRCCC